MSVELEAAARLNALKQGIEAKMGETYPDLTGGVNALIAGFGQGGSKYETGELIGDGVVHNRIPIQIPLSFEPFFVCIVLTDMTSTLDANHVVGGFIAKNLIHQASYRAANNSNAVNGGFGYMFDGWNVGTTNSASYTDGIFNWLLSPGSRSLYNGASYTWIARG